jgi:uncharacterized membrane protein HdeD (DUF308 family)
LISPRFKFMRPKRRALAARWQWARALAIAFFAAALALIAGTTGLAPAGATVALGWSLVALGAVYAGGALRADGGQARGLLAAVGAAYGVCGCLLLVDAVLGPLLLLVAVSVALILGGIVQAVVAIARPHAQSAPAFGFGLALAALGAAVALEWPLAVIPALGTVFGMAAAAQGAAYLRLAAAGERLAQRNLFGLRKNPSTRHPSGARATWRLPFGRQT